jgi:acetoacetyl-CoA reductase/3-oxoacyl-[acyl-carrier protein] reductase
MPKSRVAFVTGASGGIGACIAKKLSLSGIEVIVGYCKNSAEADKVVSEILDADGTAKSQFVDVSRRGSIRDAVEAAVSSMGRIDILVNNAAIAQEKPFLEISDVDWDNILGANLRGPFAFSQEVLPAMMENRWGRIINIASVGGQWGGINQIHYASSKSGLIGLTRSLAKTFGGYGITINAVSPGLVATKMTQKELASEAGLKKIKAIPCGRLGLADEVASAVDYLASDISAYITGQTINVNGGMYFG